MKSLKKLFFKVLLVSVCSTSLISADTCAVNVVDPYSPGCVDTGGCGYADCCTSPCLTPAIALGAIAVVAIVAVAVQNRHHHGHGHGHN